MPTSVSHPLVSFWQWTLRRFAIRPLDPDTDHAQWHERFTSAGLNVCPDRLGLEHLASHGFRSLLDAYADAETIERHRLARDLGAWLGAVFAMRVACRGWQPDRFVVDAEGRLLLRDAAGFDGFKGTPLLAVSLPVLLDFDRVFQPSRTQRMRFFKAMIAAWPKLPDGLHHLPRHRDFR